MTAATAGPFFIGTCRVHGPAEALRRRGYNVYATPNRLHTPMQTLQFVEHVGGHRRHYTPETVHLLSDFAMQHVVRGRQATAWSSVQRLRASWRLAELFFVEISSLTEFRVTRSDGSIFYANTFTARDMRDHARALAALAAQGVVASSPEPKAERLSAGRAIAAMRRIKAALGGRPIVWLSHARPPAGDPQHARVLAVRGLLADILRDGAAGLGDRFFDPSTIAAELGAAQFFEKDGTDLGHFTRQGIEILAEHYRLLAGLPPLGSPIDGPWQDRPGAVAIATAPGQ
jgi:hypothetical protein